MAKDPAFLFYSGDFLSGTQFFTDEQTGKYIRLLVAQHQIGHLEEKHMLQICKTYDKDVFLKFIRDDEGLFYNERLETEILKRKNYTESRSKNRMSKKTYVSHMENVNENINKEVIKEEKSENIISENDINQTVEFLGITTGRRFKPDEVTGFWKAFLIHSEKEFYPSRSKKIQHFRNWLKQQKFEVNGKSINSTDEREKAIERNNKLFGD